LALADLLKLDTVARDDVSDARTVPVGQKLRIEFNPNRPYARIRYSVAHEIAHTLFADCAKTVRHRAFHRGTIGDEWQLETLCNIAAAEFLMPVGTLSLLDRSELSVDHLLELRTRYRVSSEALFIRMAQVSEHSCAMFCASRSGQEDYYHLDYAMSSRSWGDRLVSGLTLPASSVVAHCTAVGYTAKGDETWVGASPFHIQCLGIPAYPGSPHPRVVGILTPKKQTATKVAGITEVKGNALAPRGTGRKLIVHVVNDATSNWGGIGFAKALRNKWPAVQEDFKSWAATERTALSLGNVRIMNVNDDVSVASMVCQKGYGPSTKPRIRYAALRRCLAIVAEFAAKHRMSANMPRIGCGQAGGRWEIVRELIATSLCANGIPATVYDLPNATPAEPLQKELSLVPV